MPDNKQVIGAPSNDNPEVIEAHSKLGPSSSERWLVCHGSVQATANAPDTSSSYAAEGTAAHTLAEMCDEEGVKAEHFLGREVHTKSKRFPVTWEMVHAVQDFLNYVDALPGEDGYIEERVHYDAFVPGGFGTADSIKIHEEDCYVTDLKYGKGIQVFAKNNPQLKLYAVGVFQDFGHLYDIKNFHLAIHQPRLNHVDEWSISVGDLLKWVRDEVIPAYESAMGPNPPFVAGNHCQFCAIKGSCATRAETTQAEFLADLDGPVEMSGDEIAEILDRLPAMRAWCKDVETEAWSRVQKDPDAVGDWKIVEGKSNRVWKNDSETEKALRGTKLKVGQIFVKKMVSPAQAEGLLGKKHPVLNALIRKPPGSPVLVAGSDPRPPLQVKAEDEFDDLENATEEE